MLLIANSRDRHQPVDGIILNKNYTTEKKMIGQVP